MQTRNIKYIVIHCSATKEGKHYDAKDIDQWHKARGYKMIGYHYVILLDGTVQIGRPENMTGAHVTGYNRNSIGICYVGGLNDSGNPKDTRTDAQKKALRDLLTKLRATYPYAKICGHRDFAKKACPCFNAAKEYEDI